MDGHPPVVPGLRRCACCGLCGAGNAALRSGRNRAEACVRLRRWTATLLAPSAIRLRFPAGYHHPAGMRPGAVRRPETAGCRVPTGRGDSPRRTGRHRGAGPAGGRTSRGAARGAAGSALNCQRLIALLVADPPAPYAEISARLGIPVGSIGPTRRRCLDKLRQRPAIAALITAETWTVVPRSRTNTGPDQVKRPRLMTT